MSNFLKQFIGGKTTVGDIQNMSNEDFLSLPKSTVDEYMSLDPNTSPGTQVGEQTGLMGFLSDPGISGMLGGNASLGSVNKGYANAENTYRDVSDYYRNIGNISPDDLQIALEKAKMTNYDPAAIISAVNMGASPYETVGLDPRLSAGQDVANKMLLDASKGGMTPEALAAYVQMQNKNSSVFESQLQQLQQQQAARGMGSAGQNLAMAMQAAQGGLNAANQQSMDIAAANNQAKMAALSNYQNAMSSQQQQSLNAALGRAQGLQGQATTQATLNADIAARNAAARNAQQMAQTSAANQFSQYNTEIQNRQNLQNQLNSKLQAANLKLSAAQGMGGMASGIADAQIRQGEASGKQAGANIGGLISTAAKIGSLL